MLHGEAGQRGLAGIPPGALACVTGGGVPGGWRRASSNLSLLARCTSAGLTFGSDLSNFACWCLTSASTSMTAPTSSRMTCRAASRSRWSSMLLLIRCLADWCALSLCPAALAASSPPPRPLPPRAGL